MWPSCDGGGGCGPAARSGKHARLDMRIQIQKLKKPGMSDSDPEAQDSSAGDVEASQGSAGAGVLETRTSGFLAGGPTTHRDMNDTCGALRTREGGALRTLCARDAAALDRRGCAVDASQGSEGAGVLETRPSGLLAGGPSKHGDLCDKCGALRTREGGSRRTQAGGAHDACLGSQASGGGKHGGGGKLVYRKVDATVPQIVYYMWIRGNSGHFVNHLEAHRITAVTKWHWRLASTFMVLDTEAILRRRLHIGHLKAHGGSLAENYNNGWSLSKSVGGTWRGMGSN